MAQFLCSPATLRPCMQRHAQYGPGWHDLREEQSMQGPVSVPPMRASVPLAALFATALVMAGILVAPTAGASAPGTKEVTAKPYAPVITSVKVIPPVVASAGGTATVTASLKNSVACGLKIVSEPMFKVTVPEVQACRSTYTAYVKLGANPTSVKRAVALDVMASNGAHHSTALLYISLQPRPTPHVISPPTTTPSATTTTTTAPTVALGGGSFAAPDDHNNHVGFDNPYHTYNSANHDNDGADNYDDGFEPEPSCPGGNFRQLVGLRHDREPGLHRSTGDFHRSLPGRRRELWFDRLPMGWP